MTQKSYKTSLALYKRTTLSLGGFFCALECFIALFLYDYLSGMMYPYVAALITALTALISIAVMPVIHSVINRTRSVVLGRYHGALILSTLVCALSAVLLFSIPPSSKLAVKAVSAALTMLLLFLSLQIFTYTAFSISNRVTNRGDRVMIVGKGIASGVAIAAVVGLVLIYYDHTLLSIEKIAYIVGAIVLAAGCCVYFSTYTAIPKLVKSEKRAFGIKSNYKRFFKHKRGVALSYLGRFLTAAAFLTLSLGAIDVVSLLWGESAMLFVTTVGGAALGGITVRLILHAPIEPSRYSALGIAGSALTLVAVAVAIVLPLTAKNAFSGYLAYLALGSIGLMAGVGFGMVSSASGGYMEHTFNVSDITRGTHKCLMGMLTTAALSVGVIINAIVESLSALPYIGNYGTVILGAAAGALSIAGAVLSIRGEHSDKVSKG